MARTHDGITAPLPPRPIGVLVGAVLFLAGIAAIVMGWACSGVSLLLVGLIFLVNERGARRIRVITSRLLVEDERMLTALLIGPRRSRAEWPEVRGLRVEGGALVVDTVGQPFVTGQGAPPDELEALRVMAEAAWRSAQKEAARTDLG